MSYQKLRRNILIDNNLQHPTYFNSLNSESMSAAMVPIYQNGFLTTEQEKNETFIEADIKPWSHEISDTLWVYVA